MSLRNPYNFNRPFRETLNHQDHIHNQIEACVKTFNEGFTVNIANAVEALQLLVTPDMLDEQYLSEMQELDEKWQEKSVKIQDQYRRQLQMAKNGCPDLVTMPSTKPDSDHFKQIFMVVCALFARRNLMLKVETEDDLAS